MFYKFNLFSVPEEVVYGARKTGSGIRPNAPES